MACRVVSPVLKKYIDKNEPKGRQKFERVRRLFPLMKTYSLIPGFWNTYWRYRLGLRTLECFWNAWRYKSIDLFCENYERWGKIKVKSLLTSRSKWVFLTWIYVLIAGFELYINDEKENDYEDYDELWCPLYWAVHHGNFEFVEVMSWTPFDFNGFQFNIRIIHEKSTCEMCEARRVEKEENCLFPWFSWLLGFWAISKDRNKGQATNKKCSFLDCPCKLQSVKGFTFPTTTKITMELNSARRHQKTQVTQKFIS